jgi:pimeloyl-ACP methyl ester carboxylesterase
MKRPRRAQRRRRIRRVLVRALRRSFPHLGRFTPSLSSRLAEALFITPPKEARLRREERALEDARFSRTPNGAGYIPTWKWGEGRPVVLVHGWGGHAGRLTEFVAPLVRRGFSVIAFDAPGHGDAGGRNSSLTDFVGAIRAIARKHGPFEAMIGHSLGAAACALAVRHGLEVSRVVLLAPPADPEKYSGRFARFYRMSPETREGMKRRLESRYRIHWPDLKIAAGDCPARMLVFHDEKDTRIPFRDGVEVVRAWPNAALVRTRGLGHHRILCDPRVISRAVAFVGNGADHRGADALRASDSTRPVRCRQRRLREAFVS